MFWNVSVLKSGYEVPANWGLYAVLTKIALVISRMQMWLYVMLLTKPPRLSSDFTRMPLKSEAVASYPTGRESASMVRSSTVTFSTPRCCTPSGEV